MTLESESDISNNINNLPHHVKVALKLTTDDEKMEYLRNRPAKFMKEFVAPLLDHFEIVLV